MFTLTTQLDRIENNLPPIPAKLMRLQRTVAAATADQVGAAVHTLVEATRSIVDTSRVSGRTVTGQTRAAGASVASNVQRNANQVVGQAKAQTRRVSTTARNEVTDVIDSAIDAVAGDTGAGSGKPYESRTKGELLERAKELGLEGRSGMNKKQLIAALRKA